MRDTWEHLEAVQGIEVKSVAVNPSIINQLGGADLRVDVALTGPAPVGGVNLVVLVAKADHSVDVSSQFAIPSPLAVAASTTSKAFLMPYNGGLLPGPYVVSVAVQGGVPQVAGLTIQ